MIFSINWDSVFVVRVANGSTFRPRSGPGQGARSHCPSQPDGIVGTGQIGDVIDDDILGSAGSWKMLEKMSHLKKQLIFAYLKHVEMIFLARRRRFF